MKPKIVCDCLSCQAGITDRLHDKCCEKSSAYSHDECLLHITARLYQLAVPVIMHECNMLLSDGC